MKNLLFYIWALFMLFLWIPYQKEKIEKRVTIIMTDSSGRKISITDVNNDGTADVSVGQFPAVKRLPTEEEQNFFREHKKRRTP